MRNSAPQHPGERERLQATGGCLSREGGVTVHELQSYRRRQQSQQGRHRHLWTEPNCRLDRQRAFMACYIAIIIALHTPTTAIATPETHTTSRKSICISHKLRRGSLPRCFSSIHECIHPPPSACLQLRSFLFRRVRHGSQSGSVLSASGEASAPFVVRSRGGNDSVLAPSGIGWVRSLDCGTDEGRLFSMDNMLVGEWRVVAITSGVFFHSSGFLVHPGIDVGAAPTVHMGVKCHVRSRPRGGFSVE